MMVERSTSVSIVQTLDAILAHKTFASSPKAQDFLRYIVMEALAGRTESLNGTTIAQDIFDKGADFDPLQDSVVRVTARRVRYMLQDYYAQQTVEPDVKISIPKGKYRPHFEYPSPKVPHDNLEVQPPVSSLSVPQHARNHSLVWLAGALAVLISVFAFQLFKSRMPTAPSNTPGQYNALVPTYPSIAIIPFTNQTDDKSYGFLEQGLQKQMTEDLSRFTLIRPTNYDKAYETLLRENEYQYDYAITGVILGVEPEIDLYIKLIDLNKTDVIFEDRIRRVPGRSQYYDSLFNIVSELSGNFAGLEGVIVKKRLGAIQDKIAVGTDALYDLDAFECYSLVGNLMETPAPDLYETVYSCLKTLSEEQPENSTLLAAFGWITYVGATSHESVLEARSINPDMDAKEGVEMIEAAIQINPENAWAQQTLSALKIHKGDIQGALKHAEMAVLENPANPDNLTWLSLCLAHAGNWERAMPYAQEALDRNPDPSSQYYYTFYMKALHDNDAKTMTAVADQLTATDNYYAKLYSYLAAIAADDNAHAKALRPHIDKMAKRNNDDIMSVIKVRMPSEDLRQKAERLLLKGDEMLSLTDG